MGRWLLGPFAYGRRSAVGATLLLFAVIFLTLITQVGGLVLWLSLPILDRVYRRGARAGRWVGAAGAVIGFAAVYAAVSVAVLPPLAGLYGRRPLPCFPSEALPYGASSVFYCAANRHYAAAPVHRLMNILADEMAARHTGSAVIYLDAGFPFIDGFPLPPHLSHDDARTIDLAFFYADAKTRAPIARAGAWSVGYWAYSAPRQGEPRPCAGRALFTSLRWDFDWLQPAFAGIRLDERRTRELLNLLVEEARRGRVRRVLLEPHLRARWNLPRRIVRFQGCRAARHDDHLHVEVR